MGRFRAYNESEGVSESESEFDEWDARVMSDKRRAQGLVAALIGLIGLLGVLAMDSQAQVAKVRVEGVQEGLNKLAGKVDRMDVKLDGLAEAVAGLVPRITEVVRDRRANTDKMKRD